MATLIVREIELLGDHAGSDIIISGHQFVKGKTTIADSEEYKINQAVRLFSFFDGYVVGSIEWQNRKDELDGVRNPEGREIGTGSLSGDGEGGDDKSSTVNLSNREGHGGDGKTSAVPSGTTGSGAASRYDPSQVKKIAEAVMKLNPELDDHWTDGGLPRLKALEAAGFANVNRELVELAAPGWNREKALAESV